MKTKLFFSFIFLLSSCSHNLPLNHQETAGHSQRTVATDVVFPYENSSFAGVNSEDGRIDELVCQSDCRIGFCGPSTTTMREPNAVNACLKSFDSNLKSSTKSEASKSEKAEASKKALFDSVVRRQKEIEQFALTEPQGLWALFLGVETVRNSLQEGVHPIELIGEKKAFVWSKAWRTLRDIPDEKFSLSTKLMSDLNKMILGENSVDLLNKLSPEMYTEKERGIFSRLWNKTVKKVFSSAGDFRGSSESQLNTIFEVANGKLNHLKEASDLEKLNFVSELHLSIHQLSPMKKMSDQTLQLMMNRVLVQLDLAPSTMISIELTSTLEDVRTQYIAGVTAYVNLSKQDYKEVPSVMGRGVGTLIPLSKDEREKFPNVGRIIRHKGALTPDLAGQVFRMGKEKKMFVIAEDGLIYDNYGIPYSVIEVAGQLKVYPLSYKSYILMSYNGSQNQIQGLMRDPTPEHIQLRAKNLEVVEKLMSSNLAPEAIEVVKVPELHAANKEGDFYFHSWQAPMLKRAALIVADPLKDPYAVLANGRGDAVSRKEGGISTFENSYYNGTEGIRISDVLGQYERKDLEYAKLEVYVSDSKNLSPSDRSEILQSIMQSRRKLHLAGRTLMRPFLDQVKSLSDFDYAEIRKNSQFYGLEKFLFKYSKLNYESYDQAVAAMGSRHVYVMRASSGKLVKFLGLRSQSEMRSLIDVPILSDAAKSLVQKLYKAQKSSQSMDVTAETKSASAGNKTLELIIDSAVKRVFISEFQFKRTEEEFQSEFITQILHAASNRGSKKGLSTTVRTDLLFKPNAVKEADPEAPADTPASNTKFAKQSDAEVYFLKVPVGDVDVAYSSLWRNQYEVYLKHGYGNLETRWKVIQEKVPNTSLGVNNYDSLSSSAKAVLDIVNEPLNKKTKK